MTLATFMVKTFGRCCSSSAALFPAACAASNSFFAACFSRILARMR